LTAGISRPFPFLKERKNLMISFRVH
jgi:hypothetical protein